MIVKNLAILLLLPIYLVGMEPAIVSPKSTPEGLRLRHLVIEHLDENEKKQAAAEPKKDEKYYKQEMSSSYRNLVNLPPVAIKAEVMAGPLSLRENKGALCAAHTVFIANLIQGKIIKTIYIPSKLENTDTHRPTPCAIDYAKVDGMEEEQILLGELDGRVSIVNPKEHLIKTFGHVPGRVLGFFVDPKGEKIAVRYESKDEAGKTIPCFALAMTYTAKLGALNMSVKSLAPNLAQSAISKRRSWAPPLTASGKSKTWSHFAVQSCTHEVRDITFEEDYCITHCATGNVEKWALKNVDTEPELVKVATIEQLKP